MKNIMEYLEESAKAFPDKVALVDANGSVTYGEVRNLARKAATALLLRTGGRINEPVAVMMEKGVPMLTAFFAVTYSGGFYTPLDVSSPAVRLEKIIDTLSPAFVIVSEAYREAAEKLGVPKDRVLLLDEMITTPVDPEAIRRALAGKIDTDPAYTLFTSGSTGVPKGVTICHRSILDYIEWVGRTFPFTEEDRLASQAPFHFDNSVLDIYTVIKTGATLYITPERLFLSPVRLIEYLNLHKITAIFWVPSVLIYLAGSGVLEKAKPIFLNKILFAGEEMPNKQLNRWRKAIPEALYANLYGPTEITDVCTYFIVDRPMEDDEPLPIGIPCDNTDILVLNESDQPVRGGEKGELCVRGSSLALGYYRAPEKTAAAFVQNPLNPYYPERIYRTGDMVRYNERHELIFLGRKDFQIKHMGYRIEIGEIETAVLSLPEIENGCILYEEKTQKIVLFYQSAEEKDVERQIQTALRGMLPKYMLPNRLIRMERLPLNQNGKIDRNRLRESL